MTEDNWRRQDKSGMTQRNWRSHREGFSRNSSQQPRSRAPSIETNPSGLQTSSRPSSRNDVARPAGIRENQSQILETQTTPTLSYLDIVRKQPQITPSQPQPKQVPSPQSSQSDGMQAQMQPDVKKKKKKKKKSTNPNPQPQPSSRKQKRQPLQLWDLISLQDDPSVKGRSANGVAEISSFPTAIAVLATPKALKAKTKEKEKDKIVKKGIKTVNPNPADSSREVIRRRKEREKPKAKKLTNLKKTILKEKAALLDQMKNDEISSTPTIVQDAVTTTTGQQTAEKESENEGTTPKPEKEDGNEDESSDGSSHSDDEDECENEELDSSSHSPEQSLEQHHPPEAAASSNHPIGQTSSLPAVKAIEKFTIPVKSPREYVNQTISPELNKLVKTFIGTLTRFQDRLKARDPMKAKQKKRLVFGLREVPRSVERNKAKAVIIAPNIEPITSPGGLDDILSELIRNCRAKNIFVIFAMTRNTLGKALGRRLKISSVSVLNYDGAEELYKQIVQLVLKGRQEFRKAQRENRKKLQSATTTATASVTAGESVSDTPAAVEAVPDIEEEAPPPPAQQNPPREKEDTLLNNG